MHPALRVDGWARWRGRDWLTFFVGAHFSARALANNPFACLCLGEGSSKPHKFLFNAPLIKSVFGEGTLSWHASRLPDLEKGLVLDNVARVRAVVRARCGSHL